MKSPIKTVLQQALIELLNSILKPTSVIKQADLTLGNAPSTVIILNCLILFSIILIVWTTKMTQQR